MLKICYDRRQDIEVSLSGLGKEGYDNRNQKRFNCSGLWDSFAADNIREAKKLMISKGHTYYQSRKLDRVPREAVEELLGIRFQDGQAECTSCTSM